MSILLQLKADGKPVRRGFEHYWSVMRELGAEGCVFSVGDILLQCKDTIRRDVADYMQRLVKAGITQKAGKDENKAPLYRLLKRPLEAPRLRRDGSRAHPSGQQQMWNAIRVLEGFTYHELAIAASTPECVIKPSTAKRFIGVLFYHNYLIEVQPGGAARPGVYRLHPKHRNKPKAPKVLRAKILYDPNAEEVVGEITAKEAAA